MIGRCLPIIVVKAAHGRPKSRLEPGAQSCLWACQGPITKVIFLRQSILSTVLRKCYVVFPWLLKLQGVVPLSPELRYEQKCKVMNIYCDSKNKRLFWQSMVSFAVWDCLQNIASHRSGLKKPWRLHIHLNYFTLKKTIFDS